MTRRARRVLLLSCAAVLVACSTHEIALPGFETGAPDAARADAATADAGGHDAARRDAAAALDAGERDAAMPGSKLPHNIIALMGDGMGMEQLSTARFAKKGPLRIDGMSGPAWANTDSLTTKAADDPKPATDSAAAATALATGVLVENGTLSQTPDGMPLQTVLEACKKAGKATGLVTTSYFFDASPAGFSAHRPSRYDYEEIVHQMLERTRPDVIMGAGTGFFDDPQYGLHGVADAQGYFVVRGASGLAAWDPVKHPRLLGLFETDFVAVAEASEPFSMTPALERRADSPDPTQATMTARALERLSADPDGFFLFSEDEIFDEMGHRGPAEVAWANRAYPAEAAAFDDALGVAIDWVKAHSSFDETLIVVFADHETGGYSYDHKIGPSSGDFSAFSEGASFRVGYHTRALIPVFALGPGSEALMKLHSHTDTHRLMLGELR